MSKNVVYTAAVLLALSLLSTLGTPAEADAQGGALCFGETVTVDLRLGQTPTQGDDVILGTPANDVIDALGGDDVVCGGRGNDRIFGRAGNDVLIGGTGNDVLVGNAGRDDLRGTAGDDRLIAGGGRDFAVGGTGNDNIDGGPGDDFVSGNAGTDVCDGGTGDETRGDRASPSCEVVDNVGSSSNQCRADATICVGPGQAVQTLTAAVATANNGDIIELKFATYNETVAVAANNVTIRSAPGAKAIVDCSGMRPAWGKACILAVGTNLTVERLRITGAQWTSGNEACLRNEPATRVIVRSVDCSGSYNGILGSGGSWLVVNSTFTGNGAADGQTHNLYFSGDCSRVVVSGITSSVSNGGHAFKSRCAVSMIINSVLIENTVADGADFSDGGIATIRDSRIEQPDGANGNMIRHGSESCSNGGRLRIEGSTIVSGRTPSYIRSTCAQIDIVNTQLPAGVIIAEP